jgi:hypothetical protein
MAKQGRGCASWSIVARLTNEARLNFIERFHRIQPSW